MPELTTHNAAIGDDGSYYCRCMDRRVTDAVWLCGNCPLFAGFIDGDAAQGVICRYANEPKDPFPVYWNEGETPHGVYAALPQEAIRFAAVAHQGALRKGNGLPYIIHPMETMWIVAQMTDDAQVMAAAALHDVIEDTKYTGRDIEARFGQRVAELVGLESEDKKRHRPAGDTWRERKEENLARERLAPREAKMIMLSDKLSNMRATLRDYEADGTAIWQKFNMKDEAEQEWYYRAVVEVVAELADTDAYREYVDIVERIFKKSDN